RDSPPFSHHVFPYTTLFRSFRGNENGCANLPPNVLLSTSRWQSVRLGAGIFHRRCVVSATHLYLSPQVGASARAILGERVRYPAATPWRLLPAIRGDRDAGTTSQQGLGAVSASQKD